MRWDWLSIDATRVTLPEVIRLLNQRMPRLSAALPLVPPTGAPGGGGSSGSAFGEGFTGEALTIDEGVV